MSQDLIMQTNPASRILVYSTSLDVGRHFVERVKNLSSAKKVSGKEDGNATLDGAEPKTTDTSDIISHTLSNKYYTADVHFSLKTIHTLTSETFHHNNAPPALIYVWTENESYSDHLHLLSHTMQSMEYEPEVCLGVRLAGASESPPASATSQEEENTDIDTKLMSYGFEYVDASRQQTRTRKVNADDVESDDDDDIPDLPRVLDALSTIMWNTMRSTQNPENASTKSDLNQFDDEDKAERDALLQELLAAGQEVRSSESQAAKESATKSLDESKPEDDEEELKLMEQMEAFINDAKALSSFSSYKEFNTTDFGISERDFTPSKGLGSLDSVFDFAAFARKPSSSSLSRSDLAAPLINSATKSGTPASKPWLDTNLATTPLDMHLSRATSSQGSSSAITSSPIDEASLSSFGATTNVPTITKHAFDDDFTEFVSAPVPSASTSTIPSLVNPSNLSLPVPSLRRSVSRSSSFTSDFGDHEDENVYAMLDDTSSYGGDDNDRDIEDDAVHQATDSLHDSKDQKDEKLPNLSEILATTRQLFGGQIPVRSKEKVAEPTSNLASTEATGSTSLPTDEGFDLESVLGALQQFKSEIGGITDEEEKRKMAARVALGLVYGLEGQRES